MSVLARILRNQMNSGFPNGNPLINIGVSVDVLDLGLTEDELYTTVVRGFAKQLVASIHPDRVGADERPYLQILQRKYTIAYEELQDLGTFRRALADFRNMKSEERSEIRVLRNALEEAQELVKSVGAREAELKFQSVKLTQDRLRFDAEDSQRKLIIPGLEAGAIRLEAQNTRARNVAYALRRKYRDLFRYMTFLGSDVTKYHSGVFAFDAKWALVAMLVPSGEVDLLPEPTRRYGWKPDFLQAIQPLGIPNTELKKVRLLWNELSKELDVPLEGEISKGRRRVSLMALQLMEGVMKVVWGWDGERFRQNRVIGGMSESTEKFGRRELLDIPDVDVMFHSLLPVLNVGNLMVSTRVNKVTREKDTNRALAFVRRETRMLILGVG